MDAPERPRPTGVVVPLALSGLLLAAGFFPAYRMARDSRTNLTRETLLQEIGEKANPQMAWSNLGFILKSNLLAFLIIVLSLGMAGLPCILHLPYLGFHVGLQVGTSLAAGLAPGEVASLTLPHGIPEGLAFFLAGAASLYAGGMGVRYLRGGELIVPGEKLRILVIEGIALALIVVSGFVEAFYTATLAAELVRGG